MEGLLSKGPTQSSFYAVLAYFRPFAVFGSKLHNCYYLIVVIVVVNSFAK